VLDALRRAGATADGGLADALLEDLVRRGALARSGSTLRLPAHRAVVGSEELERLVREVTEGEPTPPTISELRRRGYENEAVEAAVRSGDLVRIAPDLVLSRGFVDRAIVAVRETGADGITVSAVRVRLGTSRKYAVPLMEHLDRVGETRRSGDLRFARGT
jgi:selenocysteine-specific elongation factor